MTKDEIQQEMGKAQQRYNELVPIIGQKVYRVAAPFIEFFHELNEIRNLNRKSWELKNELKVLEEKEKEAQALHVEPKLDLVKP